MAVIERDPSRTKTRRAFLGSALGTLSVLALIRAIGGCSEDESDALASPARSPASPGPSPGAAPPTDDDEHVAGDPPASPPVDETSAGNPDWQKLAAELCARNVGGVAYSSQRPGPFAGKERSHVPKLTIQADGVAVIVVNHVMDPGASIADAGKDAATDASVPAHYVTTIWAKDDKGRVVFMKQLRPTDAAPPFVAFKIPPGTMSLTAFEHCNLHGVWRSDDA